MMSLGASYIPEVHQQFPDNYLNDFLDDILTPDSSSSEGSSSSSTTQPLPNLNWSTEALYATTPQNAQYATATAPQNAQSAKMEVNPAQAFLAKSVPTLQLSPAPPKLTDPL